MSFHFFFLEIKSGFNVIKILFFNLNFDLQERPKFFFKNIVSDFIFFIPITYNKLSQILTHPFLG